MYVCKNQLGIEKEYEQKVKEILTSKIKVHEYFGTISLSAEDALKCQYSWKVFRHCFNIFWIIAIKN